MSCTVEEDLTAYLDGELAPAEVGRVRAHLDGCAECRATEALLRRTVATLATLPDVEPSVALRRTVLARIESAPLPLGLRVRRWLRPGVLVPSGMGALVAAALVAVVAVRTAQQRQATELAVAQDYEVLTDYEVVGLDASDLDVVAHLDELEASR